jgi:hypothetical protein
MYCPRCLAEYREGFTRCSDCRITLLPGNPPVRESHRAAPDSALELVTVLECDSSVSVSLAQGTLDEAGIPYLINGLPWGPLMEYRPSIADVPCRIQVAKDKADQARVLLEPLTAR